MGQQAELVPVAVVAVEPSASAAAPALVLPVSARVVESAPAAASVVVQAADRRQGAAKVVQAALPVLAAEAQPLAMGLPQARQRERWAGRACR